MDDEQFRENLTKLIEASRQEYRHTEALVERIVPTYTKYHSDEITGEIPVMNKR